MVKRKIGRPAGPKELVRENVLRVRLTDDERKRLDEAATLKGVDLSTWVRDLALKAADRALAKTES